MKKIIIVMITVSLLSACLLTTAKAQENLLLSDDTLKVGEVIVVPEKPNGTTGFKVTSLDRDFLRTLEANSIANALNISTPLYIKTYGEGGTATSSFRGMGASHTQVLWDGIRIDNPMTGQTDLSALTTAFIDDMQLFNGGTPLSFSNRGAGGTVSLSSNPAWDKGVELKYTQKIASFSNFTENIDFSISSSRISYRLRAYHQKSDNSYEYNDIYGDNDVLLRTGAGYISRGMMNEFNFKTTKTIYAARLWYNMSDRNLPGSIEYPVVDGNEKQMDESIRTILSFTHYYNRGELEGKIAYHSDWMHYINKMWSTDSRNQVNSVNGRVNGNYRITENSNLDIGLNLRSVSVNTNNYEDNKDRKQLAAEITYNVLVRNRLGLFTSVNQEVLDNELLRISPSAGLDLGLFSNKDYHLKGTVGLSNHLPTLNDLYWLPGGNPGLKTEKATNMEATFTYRDVLFGKLVLDGSLTGYQSVIDNMIQWVPVSEFVWSPQNVIKVLSRGVEIDQKITCSMGKHTFKLTGSYYYTSVSSQNTASEEDNAVGKQLIYVPEGKASLALIYRINEFTFSWNSLYTGERYVTADNSESLQAFWISNASVHQSFNINTFGLETGFIVNNVFNRDYQSVKDYPMPWRSYQLSLSVKFSKNNRQ